MINDDGYKQCTGECGEILPLSEFGFNSEGSKRWSACVPCREQIVQSVREKASERAELRRNEGDFKTCLGHETYRLCEITFRSISKFNRLCEACRRAADND